MFNICTGINLDNYKLKLYEPVSSSSLFYLFFLSKNSSCISLGSCETGEPAKDFVSSLHKKI